MANDPIRLYQAKTIVRRSPGSSPDNAACSIDRNGPISPPLGLMTPIVAATSNQVKSRVIANSPAAKTISSAPTTNIRRRPIRSAHVVMGSETTVSPSSVNVSKMPIRSLSIPTALKYSTRTTDKNPYANSRTHRVANSNGTSHEQLALGLI